MKKLILISTILILSPILNAQILVDFGADESENEYKFSDWKNTFNDKYTGYTTIDGIKGTAIKVGKTGVFNYQGVKGTSTIQLKKGQIFYVDWYNSQATDVTFTPKISFDDPDRQVDGVSGTWYEMSSVTLASKKSGTSVFIVPASAEGTYNLVNVSINFDNSGTIVCDKIYAKGLNLLADFSADKQYGYAPATIKFTDKSFGTPTSWEWDFNNDGTIDSKEQNPTYTFTKQGKYTVSLTVKNASDEFTQTKQDFITVNDKNNPIFPDLLVDFGSSASENIYGQYNWKDFTMHGWQYSNAGPGGMINHDQLKLNNYLKISGQSIDFQPGDELVVTWYNNTGKDINCHPLISFVDTNNPSNAEGEPQWFQFINPKEYSDGFSGGVNIFIKKGGKAVSTHFFTKDYPMGTADPTYGKHSFFTINSNFDKAGLMIDKIEITRAASTKPKQITNFKAKKNNDNTVTLSWTPPNSIIENFRIYRNGHWIDMVEWDYDMDGEVDAKESEECFTYDNIEEIATYHDNLTEPNQDHTYKIVAYYNPECHSDTAVSNTINTGDLKIRDNMINPFTDFEYMGAFKFPEGQDWSYRKGSIAYYPSGDANNVDKDTITGSLYAYGDHKNPKVAEISIPHPKITKDVNALPIAKVLHDLESVRPANTPSSYWPGMPSLTYLPHYDRFYMTYPDDYNHAGPKLVSHGSFKPDFTDMKGLWYMGSHNTKYKPQYFSYAGNLSSVPEKWVEKHTPGKYLVTGYSSGGAYVPCGPNVYMLKVPPESGAPDAPDAEMEYQTLLMYDTMDDDVKTRKIFPHYMFDTFNDAAWLSTPEKSSYIVGGAKHYGEFFYGYDDNSVWHQLEGAVPKLNPNSSNYARGGQQRSYKALLYFYDIQKFAEVVAGTRQANDHLPYTIMFMDDFFYNSEEKYKGPKDAIVGAITYDTKQRLLFVEELKAYDGGARSVVHVFKIKSDAATGIESKTKISLDNTKIYPNPANDILFIESETIETGHIYNTEGQQLRAVRLKIGKNEINVSNLPIGVYILKIKNKNYKFVKQ